MWQGRAVSDDQRPTPKPSKISHIDINDDCLGRQPANCKTVHQTSVALAIDRPPAVRTQLRFAILAGSVGDPERASWQDGEGGRLERFIQEVAVEVVTSAAVSYRARCVRAFEWRMRRKARLEEETSTPIASRTRGARTPAAT
jgi:hypothetical protein